MAQSFLLNLALTCFLLLSGKLSCASTVVLETTSQALKTIGKSIKFRGCTYTIDRLIVLSCPSQTGLWVADAKSILAQVNCLENCSGWFDFGPDLTYLAMEKDLAFENIDLVKTREFTYSALQTQSSELHLKYLDLQAVEEINVQEKSKKWQKSVEESQLESYLHSFRFSVDGATILDYFYDLEVLAVLTQDRNGNNSLRVYETLSGDAKVLVDVVRMDKNPIGNHKIKFKVITPAPGDDSYQLIVAQTSPIDVLSLQIYTFEARQGRQTTYFQGITQNDRLCVDQLRAQGEVIVVLCKKDSILRFFDKADLSEITYLGLAYGGHWINHGDSGFDLVTTGNSYLVFFTVYQQGADDECPFGTPDGSSIIFNPGGEFNQQSCSSAIESKNVLNLVELLYDPTMPRDSRNWSYKVTLHAEVAFSYPPFQFKTAMEGAHATWLVQDGWQLHSVPICSYSEFFKDGVCQQCPEAQIPRRPNDDQCFRCDYYNSSGVEFTSAELQRFTFICSRRAREFQPIESNPLSLTTNKYSISDFVVEQEELLVKKQEAQVTNDIDRGQPTAAEQSLVLSKESEDGLYVAGIVAGIMLCVGLSCVTLHYMLKHNQQECCCLGIATEEFDEEGEGGAASRRNAYMSPAMKQRLAKVAELRQIMKPFKFKMRKLEFANQTDCCICQETLKQQQKLVVTTPCKHQFHEKCIWVWFNQRLEHNMRLVSGELSEEEEEQVMTCPMCNAPVLKGDQQAKSSTQRPSETNDQLLAAEAAQEQQLPQLLQPGQPRRLIPLAEAASPLEQGLSQQIQVPQREAASINSANEIQIEIQGSEAQRMAAAASASRIVEEARNNLGRQNRDGVAYLANQEEVFASYADNGSEEVINIVDIQVDLEDPCPPHLLGKEQHVNIQQQNAQRDALRGEDRWSDQESCYESEEMEDEYEDCDDSSSYHRRARSEVKPLTHRLNEIVEEEKDTVAQDNKDQTDESRLVEIRDQIAADAVLAHQLAISNLSERYEGRSEAVPQKPQEPKQVKPKMKQSSKQQVRKVTAHGPKKSVGGHSPQVEAPQSVSSLTNTNNFNSVPNYDSENQKDQNSGMVKDLKIAAKSDNVLLPSILKAPAIPFQDDILDSQEGCYFKAPSRRNLSSIEENIIDSVGNDKTESPEKEQASSSAQAVAAAAAVSSDDDDQENVEDSSDS